MFVPSCVSLARERIECVCVCERDREEMCYMESMTPTIEGSIYTVQRIILCTSQKARHSRI